jgi:hypothetical protein
MTELNVVWHEGANRPDNRCWLGVTKLLNDAFDTCPGYTFTHRSTWAELPPSQTGAVVVYHGDHEYTKIEEIQRELTTLKWALIIVIGDESALFPCGRLVSLNRKVWFQIPMPGARHSYSNHNLICGYPSDAPEHLAPFNAKSVDRPLNWFFSGQITHPRRVACAEQLRRMPNGRLIENAGFWQGLPRAEYYATMASAKVIPCPSGPTTPDSFRMAEALEAGCLPIVDATCPRAGYPEGFWKNIFGYVPPIPFIEDWKDLPAVMEKALAGWPENRNLAYRWWQAYKAQPALWLKTDLDYLRGAFDVARG